MLDNFLEWLEDAINTMREDIVETAKFIGAILIVIITFPLWIIPFLYWYFRKWKKGVQDKKMEIRCSNCEYSNRGCSDVPCSKCTQYDLFTPKKTKTNADRIRAMSDEELAKYFSVLIKDTKENDYSEYECDWLEWLKCLCEKEPET